MLELRFKTNIRRVSVKHDLREVCRVTASVHGNNLTEFIGKRFSFSV